MRGLRIGSLGLVLLGLSLLIMEGPKSDLPLCNALLAAQRYGEAAVRCEQAFADGGDPGAGARAAWAHYYLGHEDRALAWVDRLAGGRDKAGLLVLVATIHQQRGRTALAEAAYRRAVDLYRKVGDSSRSADTLVRLFDLRWRASGYRDAFELASQALAESGKTDDRSLRYRCAMTLSKLLYDVGDYDSAERALAVAEGLLEPGDRAGRATFLGNRGNLRMDEKKLALARRDLDQALELGAGNADRDLFRSTHLNLVELYLQTGDTEKARRHLEEAWKYADPDGVSSALWCFRARVEMARGQAREARKTLLKALSEDPALEWEWTLEYELGRAEEALGDLPKAEAAYQRSAAAVEKMRRTLGFDELKSSLLDRKRQPFESLFLLQARAGRALEALTSVERVQARTFLDAFLALPSQAVAAPVSSAGTAGRLEALESLWPVMSESPVAAPQPMDRVLNAFGDRHGLIYFEAGDELWLIRVAGRRLSLRSLGASPRGIGALVDRFLAHPEDAATAGRLGEILLPPGALPERGAMVYVVAEGALGNLPFAAVRREGRYLVEDHAVVLAPSLTALAALESQTRQTGEPAVVLADSRGDLPAAAAEAREVSGLLASTARIAGAATSGELKRAAGTRLLHLAVHTGLGAAGPWIRLADRDVSAAEVVTGRIGPRLVVLASCASAARSGRQTWGSLATAFLAAGSRAVLASLWSIEDERTREFVRRFYAEGGDTDPAGALARAQRVAIGRGLSPTHWAPFVLLGSGRPFDNQSI